MAARNEMEFQGSGKWATLKDVVVQEVKEVAKDPRTTEVLAVGLPLVKVVGTRVLKFARANPVPALIGGLAIGFLVRALLKNSRTEEAK